jgi:hypothetical protein
MTGPTPLDISLVMQWCRMVRPPTGASTLAGSRTEARRA